MYVLSIKMPIRKKSGNLSHAPRIYIYIYNFIALISLHLSFCTRECMNIDSFGCVCIPCLYGSFAYFSVRACVPILFCAYIHKYGRLFKRGI